MKKIRSNTKACVPLPGHTIDTQKLKFSSLFSLFPPVSSAPTSFPFSLLSLLPPLFSPSLPSPHPPFFPSSLPYCLPFSLEKSLELNLEHHMYKPCALTLNHTPDL